MRKFPILLVIFCLPFLAFAQRSQWKESRYEFQFGAGISNFLGELGGAPQVGTHAFRDLNVKTTKPAMTLGMRYRIGEYFTVRGSFTLGWVKGVDTLTTEFYRHYRNLDFRSGIQEFTINLEAAFMKEQMGRLYRLRGTRGKKGKEIYNYAFLGFGIFHFNPYGYNPELKKWVTLHDLHTEGQGLIDSRKPYHRVVVCIPVGIGFKMALKKKWSLGLDWGVRYTFTDYIDDVSSTYVDPSLLIADKNGEKFSAVMADKSDKSLRITDAGYQRGNPKYNDAYIFVLLSLNYKLKTDRNNLPKF